MSAPQPLTSVAVGTSATVAEIKVSPAGTRAINGNGIARWNKS